MIDGERGSGDDVFVVDISGDANNPARSFAHADEVHDRISPNDVTIEGVLAGEHALCDALADDDDRLAAAAIVINEVAALDDRHAQSSEKSRRDHAELCSGIFVVTAFD